eukprot:g6090.t1
MGEDTELFLAPVRSLTMNNKDELEFWGYAAMRGAVAHVTEMLDTGRIPLVFDLDETLVLAHTIFSLRSRETQLAAEISAQKSDLSSNENLETLLKEQETVLDDIEQLKMFSEMDRINVDGETIHAQHEFAEHDGQTFLRPVIRSGQKIFTRINPFRKDTSMLIRIRDGWDELSKYLRGEGTVDRRQRFKIWVCTAAERGYALEVWRLLDTSAELIPKKEIKNRLFCSGKLKKSLFKTFNIGPLHPEPIPLEVLVPGKKLGPLTEGFSEMAMAIIADDRLEVWEKRNQDQILQISPFNYKDIRKKHVKDDTEILRMLTVFQSVRSSFYFEMQQKLGPAVDAAIKKGFQTEDEIQQFQEMIKRGSSIVTFLTSPMNIQTTTTTTPNTTTTTNTNPANNNMNTNNNAIVAPPVVSSQPSPTPVNTVQKPEILLKPTDPRSPADIKKSSIPIDKRKISKLVPEIARKRRETAGVKRPAQLISNSEPEEEQGSLKEDSWRPPVFSQPNQPPPVDFPSQKQEKVSPVNKVEVPVLPVVSSAPPRTENRTCRREEEEITPPCSIQHPVKIDVPQQTAFFAPAPRPTIVSSIPGLQNQTNNTGQQMLIAATEQPGQFRVLQGNMVLPQSAPGANKVSVIKLPDGRFLAQSSLNAPPSEAQLPSFNHPTSNVRYVLQHPSTVNPRTPTLQLQNWNNAWAPQKPVQILSPNSLGGGNLMLGGSFQRQVNVPGNVQMLAQNGVIQQTQQQQQPHQLEIPRLTVLQTTGKSHEQGNPPMQQQIVVLPTTQPLVVHQSQNAVVAQKQETPNVAPVAQSQRFFPVAAPQTSQPFTARPPVRSAVVNTKQRIHHSMQTRSGPGKVLKRTVGADVGRIQKSGRNNRDGQNKRQARNQMKSNQMRNPNKKQKQAKGNEEAQELNLLAYMAQLEDQLDEQEASEEGEIRE